ncbi:uncharacterized protein SCHCODRAFT_02490808 [Schizophyllum commune H4-8]|uniref:uncharacterized protein n=1 Tax=Schizophyllum commune (strain H4-8 / FGSC 9210) TaxID=578458 RepID=UPI0021600CE9|nr:uncharacterized protein SCHCODRAFT_02490808 [Schizophyllum commune H4-8]KAI5895922.1 hypothetical protein SCHCODRAFT_02490808 [Schizophyllum commune H4-8]
MFKVVEQKMVPTYLYSRTKSIPSPFTVTRVKHRRMGLNIIGFVFPALMIMKLSAHHLAKASTMFCSAASVFANIATSSACLMWETPTPLWRTTSGSGGTEMSEQWMSQRPGDAESPARIPTVDLNASVCWPPRVTT